MTAINLIVRLGAAYLIADRASCTADGVLHQIEPKIVVSSRLCLAIVHTGVATPDFMACKEAWLAAQQNQTEALANLPCLLRELVELNDAALDGPGARAAIEGLPYVVTLAVAMWSRVFNRAGGAVLTSGAGHLPDHVPLFTLHPASQYIQPPVPATLQPGAGWQPGWDALPLVEAQRRIPSPWGTNHIGGGVDIATVHARGVEMESLHTWPDQIGAPISL